MVSMVHIYVKISKCFEISIIYCMLTISQRCFKKQFPQRILQGQVASVVNSTKQTNKKRNTYISCKLFQRTQKGKNTFHSPSYQYIPDTKTWKGHYIKGKHKPIWTIKINSKTLKKISLSWVQQHITYITTKKTGKFGLTCENQSV